MINQPVLLLVNNGLVVPEDLVLMTKQVVVIFYQGLCLLEMLKKISTNCQILNTHQTINSYVMKMY